MWLSPRELQRGSTYTEQFLRLKEWQATKQSAPLSSEIPVRLGGNNILVLENIVHNYIESKKDPQKKRFAAPIADISIKLKNAVKTSKLFMFNPKHIRVRPGTIVLHFPDFVIIDILSLLVEQKSKNISISPYFDEAIDRFKQAKISVDRKWFGFQY